MAGESPSVVHGFPALTGHNPTSGDSLKVCANTLGEVFTAGGSESATFTKGVNGLISQAVYSYTKDGNAMTKTVAFTYDASNVIASMTKTIA